MTRPLPRRLIAACAAPALLGGCMTGPGNEGVSSIHRPVVVDGRAHVPNCPDWSSAGSDSAARTDSNFGCAAGTNLAAMIADPNDLIQGRDAGAGPSEVPARSIKAWREVEPTSKQWTTTVRESTGGAAGGSSGGPR
ncbi:CpaD family pilus assembly lipoprotein [Sphingomonas sp.]|uniref:CpaD family pilus assembly lipoprotein n=1 Tax=Sphingomonas sp. TaxID=28214 RepID=UPI003B3A34E7